MVPKHGRTLKKIVDTSHDPIKQVYKHYHIIFCMDLSQPHIYLCGDLNWYNFVSFFPVRNNISHHSVSIWIGNMPEIW